MAQVRILSNFREDGVRYVSGEVVDFVAGIITYRKAGGMVDDAAAAVAAAIAAGGAQRVHVTEVAKLADTNQGVEPGGEAVALPGTAYTIGARDNYITCQSGSATTITVPADTTPIRIGRIVTIDQDGAGAVNIVGAGGVAVNVIAGKTAVIAGRYGVVQLIKKGSNRWTLFGALA